MTVKKILFAGGVVAVLGGGFYFVVVQSSDQSPTSVYEADSQVGQAGSLESGSEPSEMPQPIEKDPVDQESVAAAEPRPSDPVADTEAEELTNSQPERAQAEMPSLPFDLANAVTLRMDPPLRDYGAAWLEDGGRNNFSMPLPDGRELPINVERFIAIGEDGGEFIGSVDGYPGSRVNLSYRGNGEAGTIRLPSENRMYVLFPGANGDVILQERAYSEGAQSAPPNMSLSSIPPAPNFVPTIPPEVAEALKKQQQQQRPQ